MRLIYVMPYYYKNVPTHFEHLLNLINALAVRGIQVLLVVERGDAPERMHPSVEVVRLRSTHPLKRRAEMFRLLRRRRNLPGEVAAFIRISAPTALVVKAALGSRGQVFLWNSATNFEADRERPASWSKARWFVTSRLPQIVAFRYVDKVATGPEPMVDYYAEHGVDRAKLALLYNDIDVARFDHSAEHRDEIRETVRRELGIDRSSRILLFVHRLSPVKRAMDYLPTMFETMRRQGKFAEWDVVVVGGGPDLPLLNSWVAEFAEEKVHLLGDQPNSSIQRFYAAADAFIQPSRNEGFPRVILEAMAAGLPIVTTDAGGTRTILGDFQQDFVVSALNPIAFADKVAELLSADVETLRSLGDESKIRVQRYDTQQVARMYEQVLFADG